MTAAPVLEVRDLHVTIGREPGAVHAVRGVSLTVHPGEVVGVVGETGSGKTLTGMAALGLLPAGATATGSVRLGSQELLDRTAGGRPPDWRRIRGAQVAMVFQNPGAAFDPVTTVGGSFVRVLRAHGRRRGAALALAAQHLADTELPDPARVLASYPHQLSGGQLQRAMIALALCCTPRLLVADEATSALDVTVARQVRRLLLRLQRRDGFAVLTITHNLGEARDLCDRLVVLQAGRVVETGPTETVFADPQHAYTRSLLEALPGRGPTAAGAR